MQLEHEFVVPVPVDQAWGVLLDVERIAPCMPGATVESFDGETVNGKVKVKVGPIQVTYGGTARFVEKDEVARRVRLDASGKEARGSGTAKATIDAVLLAQGDGASTKVNVSTDLAITGKPAQFGRGVMVELGNKLLGRFADCLAEEILSGAGGGSPASSVSPATPASEVSPASSASSASEVSGADLASASGVASTAPDGAAPATASRVGDWPDDRPAAAPASTAFPSRAGRREDDDAIDLLDIGGAALAKRAAPVLAGLLVLLLVWRLLRRR